MECLIENLMSANHSDVVWVIPGHSPVTVGELLVFASSIQLDEWIGKSVAIGEIPSLELFVTLLLLDGIAESMLILPAEDSSNTRESRLADCGIDKVIEGVGFDFSGHRNRFGYCTNSYVKPNPDSLPKRKSSMWFLPTSGTTGIPKLIGHSLASLTRHISKKYYGDTCIWGSMYSFRRFAGLQVFLQCWYSLSPLVLSPETGSLDIIVKTLTENGCNSLSATPTMWRKLSMSESFSSLELVQITLGGETIDQQILNLLSDSFPNARITHIYASTELGVGFVVRDKRAGFPITYLREHSDDGKFSIGDNGRLLSLLPVNDENIDYDCNQWLDTGDVVSIVGDRVMFLGRSNGSINVGGNKVMPEEVETVIQELDEINIVHVRPKKSAIVGNLLEAVVVLNPGNKLDAALKAKIVNQCRTRLDGFKVPAFVVESTGLELTESGKLLRSSV
jgi:acyl-CoA synthetase (AMP-forming)/AMP-acid ligase II